MIRATTTSRPIALALAGGLSAGVFGLYDLGSDQWVASGYSKPQQFADVWRAGAMKPGALKPVVADEAYWLKAGEFSTGSRDMSPAVTHVPYKLAFGPLDVLTVTALPADLSLPGGSLQPMVLVTARETTTHGSRVVHFIVEADTAPAVPPAAAKGL